MDVLSELLADLRLEGTCYCALELRAPWTVDYPGGSSGGFHVVTAGHVWLDIDGRAPLRLEAGDVAVLPRGVPHRIRSDLPARPVEIAWLAGRAAGDGGASALPVARWGGEGAPAAYLCGAFARDAADDHPLLAALPDVIAVRGERGRPLPWFQQHLDAIAGEVASARPGAALVLGRLSDVLFVHALRAWVDELPEDARGWAAALRDPPVARALALLHRRPEEAWTVESLGRAVGLGRSTFAARFAALVGQGPLSYLAAWRIHRARALLRDGGLRVSAVARRLGYGSEAAFATAFKRATGTAPGAYRRAHAAARALRAA